MCAVPGPYVGVLRSTAVDRKEIRVAYGEVAVRALLVTVFIVAVLGKMRRKADWREFVSSLRAFDLVPPRAVEAVAVLVGALEVTAVGLLAVPVTAPLGYALAAVLLSGFAAAMTLSLRRGSAPVCRCFGGSGAAVAPVHVVRNVCLVVAALLGGAQRLFGHAPAEPGGAALAALTGAVVAAVVVRLDDVVALFAPVSSTRSR
jgi:uncharacterized membrane protein YphA (DoxX/SURF4 family)